MHRVLHGTLYTSSIVPMTPLINVPVPAEIADEVKRFAAFLQADRTTEPDTSLDDGITDYPLWPDDEVISLATAWTNTAVLYRQIMDAVVENNAVGRWVTIPQLAEWTGTKPSTIAAFRTHLYRYINAHKPQGTLAPFTAISGTKLRPPRTRSVHYRVSRACAQQWSRVRPTIEATNR